MAYKDYTVCVTFVNNEIAEFKFNWDEQTVYEHDGDYSSGILARMSYVMGKDTFHISINRRLYNLKYAVSCTAGSVFDDTLEKL